MTAETSSVEDILKLQASAFSEHKDQMKEVMEQLGQEKKEFHQAREIMEDMVKEYDRLTSRLSLQIRALITAVERLENIN